MAQTVEELIAALKTELFGLSEIEPSTNYPIASWPKIVAAVRAATQLPIPAVGLTTYAVDWLTNLEEVTPLAAASAAFRQLRDPASTATNVRVKNSAGEWQLFDLLPLSQYVQSLLWDSPEVLAAYGAAVRTASNVADLVRCPNCDMVWRLLDIPRRACPVCHHVADWKALPVLISSAKEVSDVLPPNPAVGPSPAVPVHGPGHRA